VHAGAFEKIKKGPKKGILSPMPQPSTNYKFYGTNTDQWTGYKPKLV